MEIEEIYVSFEQARKLKELGFPQTFDSLYRFYYPTKKFEDENGVVIDRVGRMQYDNDKDDGWSGERFRNLGYIICPTQSSACEWLRNCLDILVYNTPIFDSELKIKYIYNIMGLKSGGLLSLSEIYNTYEEALTVGIDKALELLTIKGEE